MAFLDETGLAELWSLIKAEDSDVTALANTKAKIAGGSYVGTGTVHTSSNPKTLTVGFVPRFFLIYGNQSDCLWGTDADSFLCYYGNQLTYAKSSSCPITIHTLDETMKYYTQGALAAQCFNASGVTYKWVAIG